MDGAVSGGIGEHVPDLRHGSGGGENAGVGGIGGTGGGKNGGEGAAVGENGDESGGESGIGGIGGRFGGRFGSGGCGGFGQLPVIFTDRLALPPPPQKSATDW